MAVRLRRRLKALRARCDRWIAWRILGLVSTTFTVPVLGRESAVRSNAAEPGDPFWGRCFSDVVANPEVKDFVTKTLARAVSVTSAVRASFCRRGKNMKAFGIVTLISVVAVAAAPAPPARQPVSFSTMKSTQDFADCLAKIQDRHAVPWWFVSKESGGTFLNAGANSGGRPYLLLISDRAGRREILLQNAGSEGPEAKAVNQCI